MLKRFAKADTGIDQNQVAREFPGLCARNRRAQPVAAHQG
jgi:hypothetical protein